MVRHRPVRNVGRTADLTRVYPAKKVAYRERAFGYFDEYDKIMVVLVDNVQSKQMQTVRSTLRGKAIILMGKNTAIKRILADRAETGDERAVKMHEMLSPLLKDNVGLIFTSNDLGAIKEVIDANLIQAAARAGTVAPLDVSVPAGNTGMEPTKTSFFQALNIGTKITKGTVEILKEEKIVFQGEKVGTSEATLLQMLGIKPFYYGLQILHVYDNGDVYSKEILDLTDEDMKAKFQAGIARATALSLGSGFTTELSLPHIMSNIFKKFLAVSVTTDYTFTACDGEKLKEAVISGKGLGGPAPAAAAAAAPAAAAPAPVEEEEEEDDDMGMGLFD